MSEADRGTPMNKNATMTVRRAAAFASCVLLPLAIPTARSIEPARMSRLSAALAGIHGAAPSAKIWAASGAMTSVGIIEGSTANALPSLAYRSPGTQHKLSVSDRQLVRALTSAGARILGDYGSYVLLEADDAIVEGTVPHAGA